MHPTHPPVLFWAFMVVWVALGLWSSYFFWTCRNARVKRAIYPWFVVLVGVLFCLFTLLLIPQAWVLLFAVPAMGLISFQLLWFTRFCDSCGRTIRRSSLFMPLRFCPSCGAPLGTREL
jgi:hypothetical protein